MPNTTKDQKLIVLSVGGSLIVPDTIDTEFLTKFKALIEKHIALGTRFVIICGGGRTARNYQKAAQDVTSLHKDDVDWIGIHSTRLNAHLLRAIFYAHAHPRIIKNPHEDIYFKENILIAAGWRPGFSTDFDAVLIAQHLGATKLVNLSNIDYVYTKDPKKFPDAEKITEISWEKFRKLIPSEWDPGLSSPFDPVAARECEKIGLEVAVMNGKNLEELENYLGSKPFIGTRIANNL
ncbi:MAG: UMP kinase [Candidatus Taylorbacteria bacterium]|nr:UMP kinase [Candidatus Taylorbacteria bacterium]